VGGTDLAGIASMAFAGSSIHGWHRLGIASTSVVVRTSVGGTDWEWGGLASLSRSMSRLSAPCDRFHLWVAPIGHGGHRLGIASTSVVVRVRTSVGGTDWAVRTSVGGTDWEWGG
jgi:hypothetical protein